MADVDNKPGAARDDVLIELLQLHRTAVHQSDTDISDEFERRLREYREQLLAGSHKESPLTPEAILDYAGMHGLIPLRRQQWPASQVFNQKLIALVRSALSAAARVGTDASLAPSAAPSAAPAPTEAEVAQAWATYSQQQRIGKPMVAAFVLDMLARYATPAPGQVLTDEQRETACTTWATGFVNVHDEPVTLSQSRQYDFKKGFDAARALLAAPAAPAPTNQQISDYLNGLDPIQREVVEREARAVAPASEPASELLTKLRERYGLKCTQGERTFYDFGKHVLIGEAVRMLSTAAHAPAAQADATAWGVTDGHSLVHLAYSEDDAQQWAFAARNEARGTGSVPAPYRVIELTARLHQSGEAVAQAEPLSLADLRGELDFDDGYCVFVWLEDDDGEGRIDALMDRLDTIDGIPAYVTADYDAHGITIRFETEAEANDALEAVGRGAVAEQQRAAGGE